MNKSELVDTMAADAGLPKVLCRKTIEAFMAAVGKAMKNGEKISLVGFGTFSVVKKPARVGVNPSTGEPLEIPAKKRVKFKASDELLME